MLSVAVSVILSTLVDGGWGFSLRDEQPIRDLQLTSIETFDSPRLVHCGEIVFNTDTHTE